MINYAKEMQFHQQYAMENHMKKKNPSTVRFWTLITILMAYLTFENRLQIASIFRYFISMGPEETLRVLQIRPERFIVLLYPLCLLIIFIISLVRITHRTKAVKEVHTHDRTDTISYHVNETEAEHYKKQLDGFLKAGIIEKEEYNLLMKRYSRKS